MDLQPRMDADGTWRIDRVPIVTTGIEYPLSTGPKTFTEDELLAAVQAVEDPAIKVPRIKLGHTSGYNAALVGDAEQAFGRVENLVMGNNNQTVYGDYVGMPEWLAKVAPIAYPSRSIEGDNDIETNTGHSYSLVIYAVSLLGVRWPGVSTLEDLPSYYGADVPEGVEIDLLQSVAAAKNGGGMKPGDRIRAAVDIDLINRTFYDQYTYGDEQYWWWIRAERFDDTAGLQLIVDRDDGTLVRIPVSVVGSDVSFGGAVEVTEEYPDKIAAASFVAGMAASERLSGADVVVYASRAETEGDRPEVKATQGENTMDDATRRSLATRVGLDPETATEDEINTTITDLTAAAAPAGEAGPGGGEDPEDDNDGDTDSDPAKGVAVPVAASNGTVTVDAEQWAQVQAQAQRGAAVADTVEATRREGILNAAIQAGKFPPARKTHYASLLAADPEGAVALIDGLAPGLIPVTERGTAGGTESVAGGDDGGLLGMDPNLDRKINEIRGGQIPGKKERIMQAREA